MHWDDKNRVLTFDASEGSYPGMKVHREFSVVLVDPQHGTGEAVSQGRTVDYDGSAQQVRF